MMEASSINNNNLALDTTINNGYLKSSSKNYLPTSTPTTNEAFMRPRVIQWDPHMGTDQSTISVVLEQAVSDSSSPVNSEEIRLMKLVFGQLVVETNQQQQRAPTASPSNTIDSQLMWITLVANVPRFSDTQVESGNQVPLSICAYDHNSRDTAIDHWDFGVFTYSRGPGEKDLRQLKRGAPDNISLGYPAKRANTTSTIEDDQLFNQLLAPFEDSPRGNTPEVHHSQQSTLAPLLPQAMASSSTSSNPYNQPYNNNSSSSSSGLGDYSHQPVNIQPSPSQLSYGSYNSNSTMPYSNYSQGYSLTNTAPSNNAMYSNYSQQPMFNTQPIQQQPQPQPQQPQQQQQHHHHQQMMMPSMSNAPSSSQLPAPGGYHPFAGVLSKANLKIMGDLQEMTWNWTPEEWTNGRRLVQFWRRQYGSDDKVKEDNKVECGFEPIEQEAYQQQRIRENLAAQKDAAAAAAGHKKKPSPLVISCIYWQERNDYFITSVDCIYLLEGLIGVQFTVEEKNRIRRNLEGFRPLTVSKCKPECADFFKLIMSFPHPKPRNIEKDVKVFAWKTLPTALKKIIRKYTPSYSSTAVVNLND